MNELSQIYNASTYLQNILDCSINNNKKISNEEINNLLEETHKLLNSDLKISYEQYIEYLLNLTNNYINIQYTTKNIKQYIVLSDYFQLNIQDKFFNYILDKYISIQKNLYKKIYLYNPFNYYILYEFGNNKYDLTNSAFMYIFETNKNICNEISTLCSENINQESLNKCTNIISLNICSNKYVTNVNHLQQLVKLNVSAFEYYPLGMVSIYCGVNQNGISQLSYVKFLNVFNNDAIKNVNHLHFLEELNISGILCGVNQNGISRLKFIKKLVAFDNKKIKNVNHLQQLETLDISGYCGVGQNGISSLQYIKILIANDNNKIKNIVHLQQLEELDISNCNYIEQNSILQLSTTKKLNISNNKKITDVNHLQQLEELDISGKCGVDQNGISKLLFVKKLCTQKFPTCTNKKITSIEHLQQLTTFNKYQVINIIDNDGKIKQILK